MWPCSTSPSSKGIRFVVKSQGPRSRDRNDDRKAVAWQEFVGRVELARRARGMSQRDLAKAIGAREASLSDWLNQKRVPMGDVLLRFPEALNVSGHWLLTGEGTMDDSGSRTPGVKEWAFDEIAAFVESVQQSSSEAAAADSEQQMMHEIASKATSEIARQEQAPAREGNGSDRRAERKTG